ncbi:hypothetical protein CsSME_00043454 [Camellia sinensis var. sinensis]
MVAFLLTSLCIFFPLAMCIIKFLHKVWWTPIRVQYMMGLQGIKGWKHQADHEHEKGILRHCNGLITSYIPKNYASH